MSDRLSSGFCSVLLAMVVTWLLFVAQARADRPNIRIGVLLPLSGSSVAEGNVFRRGISLAQKENPDFFRTAKFIFEDSRGTPQAAISGLRRLLDQHRVNVVIATSDSVPDNAQNFLRSRSVPLLTAVKSLKTPQEGELIFSLGVPLSDYERLISGWFSTRSCKNPRALIVRQPVVEKFTEGLASRHSKFEVAERFTETEFDFRRGLAKVSNIRIDCVFSAIAAKRVSTFLSYLRENKTPMNILLLQVGGDVIDQRAFPETRLQELITISQTIDPKFQNEHASLSNDLIIVLAHGYELTRLLGSLKQTSSAQIVSALRKVSGRSGVLGNFSYFEADSRQFLRIRPRMRTIWNRQRPRITR